LDTLDTVCGRGNATSLDIYTSGTLFATTDVVGSTFGSVNNLSGEFYSHLGDVANPHDVTFDQVRDEQGGSDVTLSELETLTDGSDADSLHRHAQYDAISGEYVGLSGYFTTHRDDTANPHDTTFSQTRDQEGGSDVTLTELEELTDGSETTLHSHTGTDTLDDVCDRGAETDKDIHSSGTITADGDLKAGGNLSINYDMDNGDPTIFFHFQ